MIFLEKQEIIKNVIYKGPLITDTSICGERKNDGVVPAHPGGGCIRASYNRWIIFFATLDCRGWDSNRSIMFQIRSNAPDGPLIKEGLLVPCLEDWDPCENGEQLFKSNGMPIAFGVPKGATLGNTLMENENIFVVKWYRWAHKLVNGRLVNPVHHPKEYYGSEYHENDLGLCVEWLQFRLNDDEDDIEIISGPDVLKQVGYEQGPSFSSLGEQLSMNHSMKAPCPLDDNYQEWVEFDTFVTHAKDCPSYFGHGAVAPVKFKFNSIKKCYEWVETGSLLTIPGIAIGESCINRIGDDWIISLRTFGDDCATSWFYSSDPFSDMGEPKFTANTSTPRTSFVCADGKLRLFSNGREPNLSALSRSPLCCWDVNIPDFSIDNSRTILDARVSELPFYNPMIDMAKLCPCQGNRQLLFYRVIAQRMTSTMDRDRPLGEQEKKMAGIHYSEIVYEEKFPDEWNFAEII